VNGLPFLLLAATVLLNGCATIYTDSTQSVTFITTCANSTRVVPAECAVIGPRGSQRISTPGVISLARTDTKLSVECDSPISGRGRAELAADANFKWTGNFAPFVGGIAGGIVGGLVDAASGASNEFPRSITIQLNCSNEESLLLRDGREMESTPSPRGAPEPI
jgi:hypothetical protein